MYVEYNIVDTLTVVMYFDNKSLFLKIMSVNRLNLQFVDDDAFDKLYVFVSI